MAYVPERKDPYFNIRQNTGRLAPESVATTSPEVWRSKTGEEVAIESVNDIDPTTVEDTLFSNGFLLYKDKEGKLGGVYGPEGDLHSWVVDVEWFNRNPEMKVEAMTSEQNLGNTSKGVILNSAVYRSAASKTFDDRYLKNDGVDFFIYALVCSRKRPKLNLFRPLGRKSPLPSEIVRELDEEQKEYAEKHKAKGHLWFLKLEEGWDWTKAGGARGAKKVQDVLNYLKKFKSKDRVGGVEAIYIEINNKNKAKKKAAGYGVDPF